MVAKEQIFMALFLFVMGGWGLYAGLFEPHYDPRFQTRNRYRFSFSVFLARISPTVEGVFSRSVVVLGSMGLIAAGIYVLVHEW